MRSKILALGLATACFAPSAAFAQDAIPDPWEGFNRDLFGVHETVDQAVLEPVARGYRAATPGFFRQGVSNVLNNLRGPAIFANDMLQGEASRAGVTAARFSVNTTLGIAGLFDPASAMGLERHDEDFGQTLAVWGVASGPYIFVPLMGPTTVRDAFGRVVDTAFDPLRWAEFDDVDTARGVRTGLTALSVREATLDAIDAVRSDSLDPYVTIRSTYGLLRESAIQNGPADVQDLPDFEEIPSSDAPASPEPDVVQPDAAADEGGVIP
jgi:phospholipid-binding lipoprotein MlaA